ncbi:MAG: ion transporter [Calditrichia bacterium]
MTSQQKIPPPNRIVRFLINENLVMLLILVNTLVLFLDEFPSIHEKTRGVLLWLDYACILFFLLEALLKIQVYSWKAYWDNGWNRFDFIVVVLSLPTLLTPFTNVPPFSIFLVLRMGRLLRSIRLLRFIPNAEHIILGVYRSLKASVGIFAILFILNLAFAMGATMLFQQDAPEYFGNPLISMYSLFKVFTIEGWFEIPDQLAASGMSDGTILLLRCYFILAVICGGILGLSLANAIFVDEMTADNTRKVEQMVADMHAEMTQLQQATVQERSEMLETLREELRELRELMQAGKQKPPGTAGE